MLWSTLFVKWRIPGLSLVIAGAAVVPIAACAPDGSRPEQPAPGAQEPSPAADPVAPSAPSAPDEPGPAQAAAGAKARQWSFDDDPPDQLPAGWSAPVGKWNVQAVDDAPSGSHALGQQARNGRPVFNVALIDDARYGDIDVRVQLRAVKGRIDRGGGVVWRATDAKNYYVARYNPLEDNYRLYHVKDGKRLQLATAEVELGHDAWHTLRVRMVGDHIEGFLDGDKHWDVRDATFAAPGMVGLWTKADAKTQFDDLQVEEVSQAAGDDATR